MNTLEDRLEAALRQTADEIPPHSVPPLRLGGGRRWRGLPRAPGRFPGTWLAPLAAAAAVTAVIATSVAVSGVIRTRPPAARSSRAAAAGTVRLRPAPAIRGIPAYDVALAPGALASHSTHAVVRATATGAVVATVRPPRPYGSFTWVSGSAGDRAFVLAAQPWNDSRRPAIASANGMGRTRLFLLRLDPAAGTARLTALPLSSIPGGQQQVSGIALSPDGTRLAVALTVGGARQVIKVFSVASGSLREWVSPPRRGERITTDLLGGNPLSWTADGRELAFDEWAGNDIEVYVLDTAAPGGSLGAARHVMTFRDWATTGSVSGSAVITPDGTKIAAMAVPSPLPGTEIQAREFSAATGKELGILARLHYRKGAITGWPNVLWAGSSGSRLIVSVTRLGAAPGRNGAMTPEETGVVTSGRFTPLPGIPSDQKPVW